MTRLIKLPDFVLHHSDVNVRLAAQNLQYAVAAARRGDIASMATCIRIAHSFEEDIPSEVRFSEVK